MNKDQTKEAIKVMQAWVDGKEIQHRNIHTGDIAWSPIVKEWQNVGWYWGQCDYRIKPEVVRYRRALAKRTDGSIFIALFQGEDTDMDVIAYGNRECFIRWIDTEWQDETV